MTKILLVEDKLDAREYWKDLLEFHGFLVDEAPNFKTALHKVDRGTYDAFVLDLRLPDGNGIRLFDTHAEKLVGKTIVMTADASIPGVVDAIKKGAFNYLEKPFSDEMLIAQVNKIVEMTRIQDENRSIKSEVTADFTFDKMVYSSKLMHDIVERAKILSRTDNTILLQGETGTGKEVMARAVHNESLRNKEIFLPVNCAAIPGELFESELFGFEKGAFTGAIDSYGGRFVQADRGTLFLDEIGELPMHIQSKLLRILDENVIYRLKSQNPLTVNVKLLAATNKNLEDEARMNQFRSDLYYRLRESTIKIPPLRERAEDILPLIFHYIHIYNNIYNKNVTKLNLEAENFLLNYSWDGNIRELKNTVKSIIPFKKNDTIELDDLSHSVLEGKKIKNKQFVSLDEFEKRYIYKVLKATQSNISRACEILGISRPRLYRKLKNLDLQSFVDPMEDLET
ncbi:MAG: sigma-54-dependent Fis family transcriptional regulator [bacterium]|nr:sigma-54-dependent Fis family transcriptional regulator [bacterium]